MPDNQSKAERRALNGECEPVHLSDEGTVFAQLALTCMASLFSIVVAMSHLSSHPFFKRGLESFELDAIILLLLTTAVSSVHSDVKFGL